MTSVEILGTSSTWVFGVLEQLKQQGVTPGEDFEFEFIPAQLNYVSLDFVKPGVVFKWHTEHMASWFSLKYLGSTQE